MTTIANSETTTIRESLPQGWHVLHSQESWGSEHLGVVILIRSPVKPSRDTELMGYRMGGNISNQIEKDVIYARPDFEGKREKEKVDLLGCFGDAPIYAEEIPNGYLGENSPYALSSPWFKVTTPIGHFTIGWRKRVLEISWKETQVKATAEELFPDETVTKFEQTIHAWPTSDDHYANAKKYIAKVLGANDE